MWRWSETRGVQLLYCTTVGEGWGTEGVVVEVAFVVVVGVGVVVGDKGRNLKASEDTKG